MGEATVAPDYPRKNLLVPRFAEPEEIARVIVFAASPVAGFMAGATDRRQRGKVSAVRRNK